MVPLSVVAAPLLLVPPPPPLSPYIRSIRHPFASSHRLTLQPFSLFPILLPSPPLPTHNTRSYLVLTSVILAWQLSHFDEWTAWALLIMLALYDLCAVLSPCGPLKALVNEMQADDAPDMPGLLYEATLPTEARRPGGTRRPAGAGTGADPAGVSSGLSHSGGGIFMAEAVRAAPPPPPRPPGGGDGDGDGAAAAAAPPPPATGIVPLAVARIYRLALADPDAVADLVGSLPPGGGGGSPPSTATPTGLLRDADLPPEALRTDVVVLFPPGGGHIVAEDGAPDGRTRYIVRDRGGEVRRTLVVSEAGRVLEVVRREGGGESDGDGGDGGSGRNSIKLGLGDFIFYSVLVSKAAMHSYTTFAACFLVILAGLGGTLVLLSVYHHALPALPISIFLGVAFYIATRLAVQPWIYDMLRSPFYV